MKIVSLLHKHLLYDFIVIGIFISVLLQCSVYAEDFLLTDAEADCVAQIIFMNECYGKDENLLYWSPDEAFPSFGIGHFIWYPENASGPYLKSLPAFLDFAEEIGSALPSCIVSISERHSPWHTRKDFQHDLNNDCLRARTTPIL